MGTTADYAELAAHAARATATLTDWDDRNRAMERAGYWANVALSLASGAREAGAVNAAQQAATAAQALVRGEGTRADVLRAARLAERAALSLG